MHGHVTVTYGVIVAKSRYDKVWYPGEWGAGIWGAGDKNTRERDCGNRRDSSSSSLNLSRGGLGRLRDEPKSVRSSQHFTSLQRQQTHGRKEADKTCDRVIFFAFFFLVAFFYLFSR